MRVRLAALTAAAALAVMALPGHAAPKPQIVDPAGDHVVPMAGLDIRSALFATKGTTSKVGRKAVYTPKALVVTVTYAAAPETAPGASQAVLFNVPGCGEVLLQRYFDDATYGFADCLEESFDFDIATKGSSLQFSLPFSTIGRSLKKGTALSHLRTWTGGADPVAGLGPADVDESFVNDTGSTDKTWRVG